MTSTAATQAVPVAVADNRKAEEFLEMVKSLEKDLALSPPSRRMRQMHQAENSSKKDLNIIKEDYKADQPAVGKKRKRKTTASHCHHQCSTGGAKKIKRKTTNLVDVATTTTTETKEKKWKGS